LISTILALAAMWSLGLWSGYVYGVHRLTSGEDLGELDSEELEIVGSGCPDCEARSTVVYRGFLANRGYCVECGRAGAQDPLTAFLANVAHYLRRAVA